MLSLKKILKVDAAIYILLILVHSWAQIAHLGLKMLLHGFLLTHFQGLAAIVEADPGI